MFKINSKNNRTASDVMFPETSFSRASNFDFEQVNVSWELWVLLNIFEAALSQVAISTNFENSIARRRVLEIVYMYPLSYCFTRSFIEFYFVLKSLLKEVAVLGRSDFAFWQHNFTVISCIMYFFSHFSRPQNNIMRGLHTSSEAL